MSLTVDMSDVGVFELSMMLQLAGIEPEDVGDDPMKALRERVGWMMIPPLLAIVQRYKQDPTTDLSAWRTMTAEELGQITALSEPKPDFSDPKDPSQRSTSNARRSPSSSAVRRAR